MDIFLSLLALVFCIPILALIALLIKLDSPGPAFYTQNQVKKGGKEFDMFKFRTMFVNAEEILRSDPVLWAEYQKDFKIKNDPRVTKVGKFLRKSSLDELPQIINILKGEMSIVGPRAYRKEELEHQVKTYPNVIKQLDLVLTIKPGLTGAWQVSGRSNISFEKRMEIDYNYAKKKSTMYDILLIFLTIPAVFRSKGAW